MDNFLAQHGLAVDTYRTGLTLDEMFSNVEKGRIPVASVNRGNSTHLVVVTGYDLNKNQIIINDPIGWVGKHESHKISFEDFKKEFNYRGFVVGK